MPAKITSLCLTLYISAFSAMITDSKSYTDTNQEVLIEFQQH
jgi:hypothetical protein